MNRLVGIILLGFAIHGPAKGHTLNFLSIEAVEGVRTWFYYTDEGLAAELDDRGTVTRTYGFHPHSFGSSNPLFVREGEQFYWILNDASGFPVRVVQPDGGVVWAGQHDSFGGVTVDYEILRYPFRFPGQYYDQESDLYYNWHRYYDPDTGRYLSWDPAEDGSNHYLYVENNPYIYVDPDGQKLIWWAFTTFTPQGKALKYAGKFLKAVKKVPGAKKLVNKARRAMKRKGNGGCFVAGTLVETSEGLVPIEQMQIGDLVYSKNTNNNALELQPVSQVLKRKSDEIISIWFYGEIVITTPEHPFWVIDLGWVAAKELKKGNLIFTESGGKEIIEITSKTRTTQVFNLEISSFHSYYISSNSFLVHNGIRNCGLAGERHPDTGVPFDMDGNPEFDKVPGAVKGDVKLPGGHS